MATSHTRLAAIESYVRAHVPTKTTDERVAALGAARTQEAANLAFLVQQLLEATGMVRVASVYHEDGEDETAAARLAAAQTALLSVARHIERREWRVARPRAVRGL